ncbi:MAG: lysozyme inhibitor LprI family protein [Mesorhizobium sp.]|nr:lysozyme inhibitor LprI family protein [Mesorhizobium sp.]
MSRLPLAFSLFFLVGLRTASGSDWYTGDYERCGEQTSTLEIVECVIELYDEWDARLNAIYQVALDAQEGDRRTALRDVQRAWLAYRDANCTFYRSGEGTIAAIEGNTCMFALTRDRALELEAVYGN